MSEILRLSGVFKSYDGKNNVLKNIDLKIEKGELIGIIGQSEVEKVHS